MNPKSKEYLDFLKEVIKKKEIQKILLKNYTDRYSFGITMKDEEYAFILRVVPYTTLTFPESINIDGVEVKIITSKSFVMPTLS